MDAELPLGFQCEGGSGRVGSPAVLESHDQFFFGSVLQDVAHGSGRTHGRRVLGIPERAEREHGHLWEPGFDLPRGFDAVQERHTDVQHGNVRLKIERQPDGSYEVVDTKLARHARPEHVLQLCFYTEQLARIQGRQPDRMHVVTGIAIVGLVANGITMPSFSNQAVAMIGSNTRDYKRDTGEGLYRRSMYTFWKRSAPPASMDVFNAPSREVCTVRRERSSARPRRVNRTDTVLNLTPIHHPSRSTSFVTRGDDAATSRAMRIASSLERRVSGLKSQRLPARRSGTARKSAAPMVQANALPHVRSPPIHSESSDVGNRTITRQPSAPYERTPC